MEWVGGSCGNITEPRQVGSEICKLKRRVSLRGGGTSKEEGDAVSGCARTPLFSTTNMRVPKHFLRTPYVVIQ